MCVWCDPSYPDAWRDPAMLDYINRRGAQDIATLIRFNGHDGICIFPPTMTADHKWLELDNRKNDTVFVLPEAEFKMMIRTQSVLEK
jgi:hypothetical protein